MQEQHSQYLLEAKQSQYSLRHLDFWQLQQTCLSLVGLRGRILGRSLMTLISIGMQLARRESLESIRAKLTSWIERAGLGGGTLGVGGRICLSEGFGEVSEGDCMGEWVFIWIGESELIQNWEKGEETEARTLEVFGVEGSGKLSRDNKSLSSLEGSLNIFYIGFCGRFWGR